MRLHHRIPCAECPWRRDAPRGWLGGNTAEVYADAVANNEVPACHLNDHGPENDRTSMCAGALSVMVNCATSAWKTKGGDEARAAVGGSPLTFAHPAKFFEHHTGREYVPFIIRRMSL